MTGSYKSSFPIVKVNSPKKIDVWTIRILIGCGLVCMIFFVLWFIDPIHVGYGPIYWLLTCALFFKLLKMLHEWYHYWSVSVPTVPVLKTKFTVDILTTSCPGEPREMIIRTLKAMAAIKYPHINYLCDEGNDPVLKKACEEIGIIHVTRIEKKDAKAGNINNALRQATGDLCVILDPDHEPIPEFLDRVIPYFEDTKVGYVQCVQAYKNQSESFIARGAAEQSYHFYGPMMMCMNSYGTAQAIGANCTFRRKALDSIGGHAPGLAEDMHTAMQLQAKGWKPLYVPEILTRGLAPATISAYYKQQLKWSRGCFELLFRTYPSLFKKFTWRQKIQHFSMPIFFLFGIITFIDILIPMLALGLAQIPWAINLQQFAFYFLPLCGLSIVIRLFSQRWLLEKQERGFHFAGGILRTATWWIFLVGFIYAIFNIQVPYIPTPKEEEHENYWKLSIPNMLVILISVVIIIYGLSIDWTPYSLAMAFYAAINISMLGVIVLVSQQKFLLFARKIINSMPALNLVVVPVRTVSLKTTHALYGMLRSGPIALIISMAVLFVSYSNVENDTNHLGITKEKELGGFYSGIAISEKEIDLKEIENIEKSINNNFEIISIKNKWDTKDDSASGKLMNMILGHGAIPMIAWSPDLKSNSEKNKMCKAISNKEYDDYLKQYAVKFRSYREPVFISFSPGFDSNQKPLSYSENYSSKEFIKAWQYLYTFFNELGVSNLTWVWCPENSSSINFYPGTKFVDWIGVSCLNYGENLNDHDWYSFSELYSTYRNSMGIFQKPVVITELGTATGVNQSLWMKNAFSDIQKKYNEIKAAVIYNDQKKITLTDSSVYFADFSINGKTILAELESDFKKVPFSNKPLIKNNFNDIVSQNKSYKSVFVKGNSENFSLLVNGKPYYIRGVSYNTEQDWRDGNMPLTRRQVEKDFKHIKEMGANTIRRYDFGIYDKNILNIANEYGLKVVFGFWFDPEIDYYRDTIKVKEYIKNVEENVLKYKNYPSVIAWSLGNETWGLLKHNYSKPYLTKVREQYVKMIELLAQRIHKLDPNHPVFSCMEHEEYQLPGELVAFHDGVPSVDVIGINSYYKEQISQLNHIVYQFDSLRPYLISEFGPKGYWNSKYNRILNELIIEDSENEKAEWYKKQWSNYVIAYKGFNIGGFAYCWHDRMEGSSTWFGLTDYKGRVKPSYYALKELWTKQESESLPQFSVLGPAILLPGKEYTFSASSSIKKENLNYEWHLHKDDYLARIKNIEYNNVDGSSVIVTIPVNKSDYRLYLYVSDELGNVTTASIPVSVK